MNFSDWLIDETKKKLSVPVRTAKKKVSSIAHTDIDRWLKSVDDLAKDLNDLKKSKIKFKSKMDQIGKSKTDEPDTDKNSSEKERSKDIEIDKDSDSESELSSDAEDGTDVKVTDDKSKQNKSKQNKLKKDNTE